MIQRIQSVYLLVVAALSALVMMAPLADLTTDKATFVFNTLNVTDVATGAEVSSTWPVMAILVAVILVSVYTILQYKNRLLQIRLAKINGLLSVLFYAVFFFYFWLLKDKLQVTLHMRLILALPLVSYVMNWLAIRAIKADEALVKSLDRIR